MLTALDLSLTGHHPVCEARVREPDVDQAWDRLMPGPALPGTARRGMAPADPGTGSHDAAVTARAKWEKRWESSRRTCER